jgi:hypothetical protein
MNPSYQYTHNIIRGEEATQGQGEEPGVFGNRASPHASSGDALPSLSDSSVPSYQHPVSDNSGNDADNKKKERVTPAKQASFLVVATHLASMILRANNVGVNPFLPPTGANEVD